MSLWKIKLPRGKKENLPTLSLGELAYITDDSELYIGGLNGENINITNNASLNDIANKMNDVLLFEGEVYTANTVINLSESLENLQEIIFDVGFNGYEGRTFRADKASFELKGVNLANSGTSKILSVFEISVTKTSDTVLTIARNFEWIWGDSDQTSYNTPTLNNAGQTSRIMRIYGRY